MPDQEILAFEELSTGHINDTYLVTTTRKHRYVFQKINKEVFIDVPALMANKVKISLHLHHKLAMLTEGQRHRRVLSYLKNSDGGYFFEDKDGDFWNATYYIFDSQNFETVFNASVAYECGKLFGGFISQTQDYDAGDLIEVIPRFHDMSFRYQQFDEAMKNATRDRISKSRSLIDLVYFKKQEMMVLQELKDLGKIKIRVTHNDTKISNALFDLQGKGLCVIDTDTVMPGIVHYDFGDAIRTICNSAAEDERNLNKIKFNKDFYKAYTKGYLEALGDTISDFEIKYFPLAAKTMIFIMGLRFLTDYLNGDIYYKTNYREHNLVRSKNQFKLLESFETLMDTVL